MISRLRSVFLPAVVFLLAPGAAFADDSKLAPLFRSDAVLDVTIKAPFDVIMKERSREDEEQGQFIYEDPVAGETTLNVGVRVRGRYRAQKDVCNFAPIRLNFRKTKGTLLAKSDKLKLVTHCRNNSARHTQSLLREYLAYRILNALTEASFRVRLLRVTYVNTGDGKNVDTNYAFLIEHRDQLAKRLDMNVDESESTTVAALDAAHTNLASVFQFLIGNTDFSPIKGATGERCCHNYVLMRSDAGTQLSIPYDFDMSGIVDAPYATPNPRFKLRNVRERLYRGRCANNEHIDRSLQTTREQRPGIYNLLNEIPDFSNTSMKKTTAYLNEFFKIADSPKQVERRLVKKCI